MSIDIKDFMKNNKRVPIILTELAGCIGEMEDICRVSAPEEFRRLTKTLGGCLDEYNLLLEDDDY